MKQLIKAIARVLLGEYSAYYVYAASSVAATVGASLPGEIEGLHIKPVDRSVLENDPAALIRKQAGYAGEGARAFACWLDGRIVAVCFYWFGQRYLQRNFWSLREGEAKLVQIVCLPEMRGRGLASKLIAGSCREMGRQGFQTVYARIWHSNIPSWRAFERAGWQRIALVLEANPFRRPRPLRLCRRLTTVPKHLDAPGSA